MRNIIISLASLLVMKFGLHNMLSPLLYVAKGQMVLYKQIKSKKHG